MGAAEQVVEDGGAGARARTDGVVRIGILGCARIAPAALVRPARKVVGAEATAVASRDLAKATRFARKHGIPRAYGSYDHLLEDPDLDAVYVPLPNSMHAEWSVRALRAGKHVLCEKPVASSEAEARTMAGAARGTGLVAMEAFHFRYHPVFARVLAIAESGELGELRRINARLGFPLVQRKDIRWDPSLAGGAAMDVGCYVVNAARALGGREPEVVTASAVLTRRGVDRSFEAALAFPGGVRAKVAGSLMSPPLARLVVEGSRGSVRVFNPFAPHIAYRMRVTASGARRRERVTAGPSTYTYQLEAFVSAVRGGPRPPTDFEDAALTLRVLDRIRSLAGVSVPGAAA